MPSYLKVMGPGGLIRGDSSYRVQSGWFDVLRWEENRPAVGPGGGSTRFTPQVMQGATFRGLRWSQAARPLLDAYTSGRHLSWVVLEVAGKSGTELWYRYDLVTVDDMGFERGNGLPSFRISLRGKSIRFGTGPHFGIESFLGLRPLVPSAEAEP